MVPLRTPSPSTSHPRRGATGSTGPTGTSTVSAPVEHESGAVPVVATADPHLRDELLRLAAAAGVAPEVEHDPTRVLAAWSRAPLLLVGVDLAGRLTALAPPRRDRVLVVGPEPAPTEAFRHAVDLGASQVLGLPASAEWVVEVLTDSVDDRRRPGLLVGVLGGSGGVGATTLTGALGQVAAARGGPALAVDADPLGPGLDRVLGMEEVDGVRWDALSSPTGRLGARALRDALPRRGGLGVLAWDHARAESLQPFAVREALSAAVRGHEVVVVDLPRAADPSVVELATRCDVVLLVVQPGVAGVAAAARVRRLVPDAAVRLVVRARDVPDERALVRAVGAPVADYLPDQRRLAEQLDLGLGPLTSPRCHLARVGRRLLDGAGSLCAV
ncbi:MAG: septum site determining protein [Nocardioides sp.]|nr:septum site determining protein [Nocardioides sp.]